MTEQEYKKVCIIHGPNLNMLGHRDSAHYGTLTLSKLNRLCRFHSRKLGMKLSIYQFNSEGKIITALHRQRKSADAVIINPAAYTHYSIAIRDAIELCRIPVIEVHLSDISKRDEFRKISLTKDVCDAQFYGKHEQSYLDALDHVHDILNEIHR